MTGFITDEIQPDDPSAGFTCGKSELDDFFAKRALSNHERGLGKTFVFHSAEAGVPRVAGFYTLCMSSIPREELARAPRKVRSNVPRDVPVALIGRLAVDQRAQGQRIGEALLLDAFDRVLSAAKVVGCAGVLVHAKDDSAVAFYARYGFIDLDPAAPHPRSMLLALETVAAAVT